MEDFKEFKNCTWINFRGMEHFKELGNVMQAAKGRGVGQMRATASGDSRWVLALRTHALWPSESVGLRSFSG